MRNVIVRGFVRTFPAYVQLLRLVPNLFRLLAPFLAGLWRAIKLCFRRRDRRGCCKRIPPTEYRRPDPTLYSQPWLMKQGLSITWDNPDITLHDMGGSPVPPGPLAPDRDYRVRVRIWNNSYDAPAVGLGVELSYLSFGIGAGSTPVEKSFVDLGVKGSAHCPVFAEFTWHTPAASGHYCLQALLVWPDDTNPENNLGQENTNVGALSSPAEFVFPVHNDATVARRFELEADMYALRPVPPCPDRPAERPTSRLRESRARWARAVEEHGYGKFPISGWRVDIQPREFSLEAGAAIDVKVTIEPLTPGFHGRRGFQINGFATEPTGLRSMVGGVTLYVEGA